MSFGSFFAGLSGLQANQSTLSVIGNNLANVNTIGFKSSRVTFNDFFDGAGFSGSGNPAQIGRGTNLGSIDPLFTQGSLQTTGLQTDLAIQGNGYFVVAGDAGEQYFTRAGNFGFNKDGDLVSAGGRFVQGFTGRDANGNILPSGSLNNINVPTGLLAAPEPTTMFDIRVNLNAEYDEDFTTTITTFDSLGSRHDLTVTFIPTDTDSDGTPDAWTYEVTAPGDEVVGGTPGTPFVLDTGLVTFDSAGNLTAPAGAVTLNVAGWTNGAAAQTIDWNLYDQNTGDALLTGFTSPSTIFASNQDGFAPGELRTLVIDQDGLISGIFSNGVVQEIARIALASFNSESGLLRVGQNTFAATNSSGAPTIGGANSGGRGATIAGSLELSNVDITREFTELIISQRGYQANSRIITTTDEVIQEALSIKR